MFPKMNAVTYAEGITSYEKQKQESSVQQSAYVISLHCEPMQLLGLPIMSAEEESDCTKSSFSKVSYNHFINGCLLQISSF